MHSRRSQAKGLSVLQRTKFALGTNTFDYLARPDVSPLLPKYQVTVFRPFGMQSLAFPSKSLLDKLEFQQPETDFGPCYFFLAY